MGLNCETLVLPKSGFQFQTQLITIKEDFNMRVILLSLMMVCLFGFHAKACWPTPNYGCEGNAEIRSEYIGSGGGTSQTWNDVCDSNRCFTQKSQRVDILW